MGLERLGPGELGLASKSLLDAQETVVLAGPFCPTWCSGLDLPATDGHRDVGDGRVLALPRAVGDHDVVLALEGEIGSL